MMTFQVTPVHDSLGDLIDSSESQLQTVAAPDEADDHKERDQDTELFTYITDRSFTAWIMATHTHQFQAPAVQILADHESPNPNSSKPANPELPQNKEAIASPVTGLNKKNSDTDIILQDAFKRPPATVQALVPRLMVHASPDYPPTS